MGLDVIWKSRILSIGTPVWAAIVSFRARASSPVGSSSAVICISVSTVAKSVVVGTGVGMLPRKEKLYPEKDKLEKLYPE